MAAIVLVPIGHQLHKVEARYRSGPPALTITGTQHEHVRALRDRVRAALANAGFAVPGRRLEVTIRPRPDQDAPGADLAITLAILLADPAHGFARRHWWMANGALLLDGALSSVDPPILKLPGDPWVGRFWYPVDRVPLPEDDALLTIVDVPGLKEAWESIIALLDVEQRLNEDEAISAELRRRGRPQASGSTSA